MEKHEKPADTLRKEATGEHARCEHCPFETKRYATPEECGHCPNHAKGCKEYNNWLQAMARAMSPY